MSWTAIDKKALQDFTCTIDSDDIKVKERIKKVLLDNRFIIHVLNNKELDEDEPDAYFGKSIFPYYMFPDIQTSTETYICYEVSFDEVDKYNSCVKVLQVIFHVLCHYGDSSSGSMYDEDTNIPRHDLLAALIQDAFNYTTYIGGGKMHLVSDVPSVTDKKWATRTLTFEETTDSNLVKTRNGYARLANKDVQQVKAIK